jgi:hypothetical protein
MIDVLYGLLFTEEELSSPCAVVLAYTYHSYKQYFRNRTYLMCVHVLALLLKKARERKDASLCDAKRRCGWVWLGVMVHRVRKVLVERRYCGLVGGWSSIACSLAWNGA